MSETIITRGTEAERPGAETPKTMAVERGDGMNLGSANGIDVRRTSTNDGKESGGVRWDPLGVGVGCEIGRKRWLQRGNERKADFELSRFSPELRKPH